MRDGALVSYRHVEHVLLCVLDALADGVGDLGGLAHANAHVALAVAHDDQSGKGHATAALDDL